MRIQTDESGKALRVVENFFVKNESNPPKTQFGERPFEFYLPAGAVVEGSAALGPGGMPVQASPIPLGDPNHFAFIFPIRPGETRFQITYRLPYSGSLKLTPKPAMVTDTIAVIMPKSMTFQPSSSASYAPVLRKPPHRRLLRAMCRLRSRWSSRCLAQGSCPVTMLLHFGRRWRC